LLDEYKGGSQLLVFHFTRTAYRLVFGHVDTVEEFVAQVPEGVYTSFPVLQGNRVLKFQEHFYRLKKSAELMGFEILVEEDRVRTSLRKAKELAGWETCRVYLVILSLDPGSHYLLVEEHTPFPDTVAEEGVRAALAEQIFNKPEAKNTHKILKREKLRGSFPQVYEILLYDQHQRVLEGASSNFFAVLAGKIWTADEGILKGITRELILLDAPKLRPVVYKAVPVRQLTGIEEAFITSSSRGVIPVIEIDGHVIGDGKPGKVTCETQAAFEKRKQTELKTI
jgi:branched-subunit amino acid aminotransferase/4-amino-4-deoxychorismate lyase